jgi:hypothetical protein
MKHFDPEKSQEHWPVVEAYKAGKLSRALAEAQLRDLGMVAWEVGLYLDNDQECDDDSY